MNKIWHTHQKGLTLLELLVTIAILAVIAAITIPIVGNILPDVKERAVSEAQEAVDEFVSRWNDTGAYSFDPDTATWTGYVDLNGNGQVDEGEAVETLDLNEDQYTVTPGAGDAPTRAEDVDFSFTPTDDFTIGGSSSVVLPSYDPITITYLNTAFTVGANNQQLTPTLTGGASDKSYSLSGTLPSGVSFDEATGTFTGPVGSAWNFIVTQVSLSNSHTCAVTSTGGAKCWGNNTSGQVGDGTTTNRSIPVDVSGLTSGVAAISVGNFHTCALTTAGGVKCWGDGSFGQLGDGTTTQRLTPVDVSGLTSGVATISTGANHSCAVTTSGGAKCWGSNSNGRLGDGTTVQSNTPVDVSGLTSGVATISAGGDYTCAVTTSGGAKCWGNNGAGRLGDGTTTGRTTPVNVSGLTSGVASISAGSQTTCAITTSGAAKCWGENRRGQVGNGLTTGFGGGQTTPADVVGLTSGVTVISPRANFTCAIVNGGAKCWGSNSNGELGDGTTTQRLTPVDVSGLTSDISSISTAAAYACAATTSGATKCWGVNDAGRFGDGTTTITYANPPTDVLQQSIPAGFPATVDVTVSDSSGSQTTTITLSVN